MNDCGCNLLPSNVVTAAANSCCRLPGCVWHQTTVDYLTVIGTKQLLSTTWLWLAPNNCWLPDCDWHQTTIVDYLTVIGIKQLMSTLPDCDCDHTAVADSTWLWMAQTTDVNSARLWLRPYSCCRLYLTKIGTTNLCRLWKSSGRREVRVTFEVLRLYLIVIVANIYCGVTKVNNSKKLLCILPLIVNNLM
jgi:hypothetical protein